MQPGIKDGDRVLVSSSIDEIRRGDIIQFRYPKDPEKYYLKRAIALPGEKVEIRDGKVFINDAELSESYLDQTFNQYGYSMPPRIIPVDNYFVMGDNRDNSSDSRYWGTVDRSLIDGKLWWKYYSSETK